MREIGEHNSVGENMPFSIMASEKQFSRNNASVVENISHKA